MPSKLFKKLTAALSVLLCFTMLFSGCKTNSPDNVSIAINTSTGQYLLIESFSPAESARQPSGAIMAVSVKARYSDLTVTAQFNGETVTLLREAVDTSNEHIAGVPVSYIYSTAFILPETKKDTVVGQIKFICERENETEVYYSGMITVIKKNDNNSEQKYVAEILNVPAETFNGDTVDDTSLPYYSFLPVGTVDYCNASSIVNETTEKSYRLLRFGRRVYDNENLKVYEAVLPSENTLSIDRCESEGKYTVLSFFTDWKAPFTVQLKEQEFINPKKGDFRIASATYSYLEIRFMYCSEITGIVEFDPSNPLFTKGEVRYEENCAVLTLTLKNKGQFYGWRAEYDENDCLIMRFLEPTRLYPAENEYGIGLYDKVIVVDAGHGGNDVGGYEGGLSEADSNLSLAFILEKELEAVGATVILTRNDDTALDTYQRYAKVLETEPDFLISIHRNGGGSNGFGSYYFNPYSFEPSRFIYEATRNTADLYRRVNGPIWHYFYLNRLGICPSVLTENGFLDDTDDRLNMNNADHQRACAKALVKGIVKYFESQTY
ncbi:MAG: N-acetylmuramoyl-L-alanine amidase [Clostridia bacterium]|nr:N-acetylmuramoyl-L-alanine amidase [Clostridia bacterium]